MGNEIGNQNSNALEEQESDEITEVISQYPNSLFVKSDLDGLKNLTGHLNNTSPTLDKSEHVKLSTVYTSLSSSENDATDELLKPSIVSNNLLDQNESISRCEYEDSEKHDTDKLAIDESLDSLIMPNEEHRLVRKQASERRVLEDENNAASKTNKALEELKGSDIDLLYNPQTSEEYKADNLDTDEYLERANIHDERTHEAYNKSQETDGSLIQMQIPGEREDDVKFWVQESTNRGSELEESILERQNECVAANTNEEQENNIEESLCKTVLFNSSEVVGGSTDESNDGIDVAYLNAIDFDIKKLVMEADENEVNDAFRTESNGHEISSNKPLEEKIKMDGIDIDSFEIQREAISPCEEEKEEGKHDVVDETFNPSIVLNDALNQNQSTSSKEHEDFKEYNTDKLDTDESLESMIMSTEEQIGFGQNESLRADDLVIQRRMLEHKEEENERASKTIDEPPKALEGLKDSAQDLPYDRQKEHEAKNLVTDEYLGREHDEQTPSARNETLKTDDTLIQKQMPEEREEEEACIWAQESTDKGNGLEERIVERQNECVAPKASQEQDNYIEYQSLVENDDARGNIVLMNSSEAVEGSIEQDDDRQCEEIHTVSKDFESLQWKNHMPNEPIDATYLDAVDLEIKKLVKEDDANEVNEASKAESNEYEDIDTDSFEIQLEGAFSHCEEDKEEEDGALEESVFEISLQTDYNPSMMSEIQRKDFEAETERVEIEFATLITDIAAEVNKHDLGLKSNEILGETKYSDHEEIASVSSISENKTIEVENIGIIEKKTVAESEQLHEEFGGERKTEHNGQIIQPEMARPALSQYLREIDKFSTELSQEKFEVKTKDITSESIICRIYGSESIDLEAKECSQCYMRQTPSKGHKNAPKAAAFEFESSKSVENVTRENHVITNQEVPSTFCISKKTIEELRQSHDKKSMASSAKGREKQKPRSSLFSNCMCCTTAIN